MERELTEAELDEIERSIEEEAPVWAEYGDEPPMARTHHEALIMLQAADCTGPWVGSRAAPTRTEISPMEGGRMTLRVCDQSSAVLAIVRIAPDYTIRDDLFEPFAREIAELAAR